VGNFTFDVSTYVKYDFKISIYMIIAVKQLLIILYVKQAFHRSTLYT